MTPESDLKTYIRDIPDFPKPGILFRDITPLLATPKAFRAVIDRFAEHYRNRKITSVIAAEARGFIFAAPLALELRARFIPVRKPKLPFDTHSSLRTGIRQRFARDAYRRLTAEDSVLLVDDLLATGAPLRPACASPSARERASPARLS
jgi:adenine phosphoribosyltransferase